MYINWPIANIATTAKGDNWVQKTGSFTIPEGIDKVMMYLYVSEIPAGGYIDNIVFTRLNQKGATR